VPAPFGRVRLKMTVSGVEASPPSVRDRRMVIVRFQVVVAR